MNDFHRDRRKIDPTRADRLGDGTPNDNNRVEIGPTQLAFREWEAAGLTLPNLERMRDYRWKRLTQGLIDRDYGGLLMFDPLNIRYATDTTNMQLWNSHNPFRACLICADGHMVMWEYKNSPFLVTFNPLVKELRSGATFFYNSTGDRGQQAAQGFAAQVDEVMRAHAGANRRLAVDKIMVHGLRALEAIGFSVEEGEEVTERTRAIKGPDEILAMKCAHHACEAAIAEMETATRAGVPRGGMSEDDVWAELHKGNIRRGGEWIETRLLASGPRTNPWFQECGPRLVQPEEIVAFERGSVTSYAACGLPYLIGGLVATPDRLVARLGRQAGDRHAVGSHRRGALDAEVGGLRGAQADPALGVGLRGQPECGRQARREDHADRDRLAHDLNLDPTLIATRSQLVLIARDPAAVAIKLVDVPRIVVASPDVLQGAPVPQHADELAGLPWLALRTYYRNEVALTHAATGQARQFSIKPRLSTDSLYVVRNAALAGLGVGIVSAWMVADDLASGRLLRLAPEWQAPPLPLYLIYPYARFYPARLRQFVAAMREAAPQVLQGAALLTRPAVPPAPVRGRA